MDTDDASNDAFLTVNTFSIAVSATTTTKSSLAKPFIKWAGGKRNLTEVLMARIPRHFNRYHELFLGRGALFFAINPNRACLSDLNLGLIIAYSIVKDNPEELIVLLEEHSRKHSSEYYYGVRTQYNQCIKILNEKTKNKTANIAEIITIYDKGIFIETAAMFIYLNKTCYNGLYRVNKAGNFNVPMGRYAKSAIVDPVNIMDCQARLKNTDILYQDFGKAKPDKGDFVYLDPPYYSVDNTSFTQYTKSGFTERDQRKLFEYCQRLNEIGVYFILSNSNCSFIKDLYCKFNIDIVEAPRSINCNSTYRNSVQEVLIKNYD